VRLRRAAHSADVIYVPTGLKSFLYAWAAGTGGALVAGPNVTGIPLLMNPANPSPLMTTRMTDAWIEMSDVRVRECVRAGTPRNRIHLVPHAIDTERFSPEHRDRRVWQSVGLNPLRKKIVYVGHLDVERKGVPQLLAAFEEIRAAGCDADLVLIGTAKEEPVPPRTWPADVYPIGRKGGMDLVQLLASSDLFLGTSRYETFWFTPLEAMACGVATVASDVGAVPTMIPDDGVQGRRVTIVDRESGRFLPDASARLAAAAIPLLQSDAQRAAMGASGRDHVMRTFSERQQGECLVEVFRAALRRA
jgi:glycosyltransferase involved in cell wall biosynthesis